MDRYDSLIFPPFSRPLSGPLALPGLAAFFHEQDDDRQGGDAIDPPPARHEKLYEQSDYDDAGEIATSDRLDGIGAERAASDLIGNSYFGAREPPHDRDRQNGNRQTRCRELLTLAPSQTIGGAHDHVGGEGEEECAAYLARPMLDLLGKLYPLAHLGMKPPQQDSSRGQLDQAVRPKRDQR